VALPANFAAVDQSLITDPQTSGGLLVSCAPEEVAKVMATFKAHGFMHAAAIGHICAPESHALRVTQAGAA
jgi:selenide,water dikinase